MRTRRLNHCVYETEYHIVWVTKYRRHFLKHYVRKALIESIYKTLRKYPDWYLYQINTEDDHVHIRIEFPPKYPISEVVQKLKAYSSSALRTQFKFIGHIYDKKPSIWSVGYFVSTVGLNEAQIARYIDMQGQ